MIAAVYVLHEAGHPDICKIGMSQNPRDRVIDIQIGNWREIILFGCHWVGSAELASKLEKKTFLTLNAKHVNGEWFHIHADLAMKLIKNVAAEFGIDLVKGPNLVAPQRLPKPNPNVRSSLWCCRKSKVRDPRNVASLQHQECFTFEDGWGV